MFASGSELGMPAHPAPALKLRDGDEGRLLSWTRSTSIRAGMLTRARIVLLANEGLANSVIAERVGVSGPTVVGWRNRYESGGMAGLADRPRPGGPRTVDRDKIISQTLKAPPKKLGVTHWSSRLLADRLGVSQSTVVQVWRDHGIQPWRSQTFKFSKDPELTKKITDVVGLYLNPPQNAVVLCVDEKSQIQALDRTAPLLPLRAGSPEKRTHDYVRHGTTTLFAALEISNGQVTTLCQPRHRHQEFLRFLKQIARTYPDQDLHLVMDNYAAHKTKQVNQWLAENPRIKVHFTPTSASWMNMVETWFSIIERQAIHRGSFTSVKDLTTKIRTFVNGWNDRSRPFTWTKPADQILAKANRQDTPNSGH